MPKPAQTKIEHEAIRQRLIQAAREINNAEGADKVTLRHVARRAGYSPAAMYKYFNNVDDLVRSTWADTLQRLHDRVLASVAGVHGPLPRLRAMMLAYGAFAEENMVAFRTTFFLLIRRPSPGTRIYEDYVEDSPFSLLLHEVQAAMAAGDIARGDANLTAQTLFGFLHGVLAADQTISDFPFLDRRLRFAHAVDVALAGVLALGAGATPAPVTARV